MRPVLAIVVIVVALGSVRAYISFVDSVTGREFAPIQEIQATGRFHVDLTISFDAHADVFTPESVLLELHGGRILLQMEESVAAGTVLTIDPVEGIVEGANEFYLKVSTAEAEAEEDGAFSLSGDDPPPESTSEGDLEGADKSRAVRIRVFRDDQLIAEETIWSGPGEPVDGIVTVHLPAGSGSTEDHDHDHEHAEKGPS
jgi:hypothetical protein